MATRTARQSGYRAKARGRQAARSKTLKGLARAGFTARGVMYVLIGWLALMIAFGHAPASADNRGALQLVGSTAIGFVRAVADSDRLRRPRVVAARRGGFRRS